MGLNMAELKLHIKDQLGGIFSSSPHPAPGGGVLPPPTFMSPVVSEGEKQKGKVEKKNGAQGRTFEGKFQKSQVMSTESFRT